MYYLTWFFITIHLIILKLVLFVNDRCLREIKSVYYWDYSSIQPIYRQIIISAVLQIAFKTFTDAFSISFNAHPACLAYFTATKKVTCAIWSHSLSFVAFSDDNHFFVMSTHNLLLQKKVWLVFLMFYSVNRNESSRKMITVHSIFTKSRQKKLAHSLSKQHHRSLLCIPPRLTAI